VENFRRKFLHLAAGVALLPAVSLIARAQAYPSRSVRIIVGFAPGGPADILARLVGQWLSERLGQPFVIENRPGAGSTISIGAVVHAPPDGYTLHLITSAAAISTSLYEHLDFDLIRDIVPVAGIIREPHVMLVNSTVPTKTVPEFIAYAKTKPGKLGMASGGIGTSSHVAGELFKIMTGVDMVHVPYRGAAPALTDLLAGQVNVYFSPMAIAIGYVRSGMLPALAVTTTTRSQSLPDTPTMGDFVPGYEATNWYGIVVPHNTPADIVNQLNHEINTGLADPKIHGRLVDLGGTVLALSPAEFGKLIADETEKWSRVIREAHIKSG
jgi:tripartite-type tricarboxylate transporter receptor subunit TctC